MGWQSIFQESTFGFLCVAAGILSFGSGAINYRLGKTLPVDFVQYCTCLRTLRVLKFLWLSETLHGLLYTVIKLGKSLKFSLFYLFLYMLALLLRNRFYTTL